VSKDLDTSESEQATKLLIEDDRAKAFAKIKLSRGIYPKTDVTDDDLTTKSADYFIKKLRPANKIDLYFNLYLLIHRVDVLELSVKDLSLTDKKFFSNQRNEINRYIDAISNEAIVIKNPVTATKPVTPILDIFNELYADLTSQRKEYQEKRLETISKYGSEWLTLQDFINRVLLKNWGESSTLSAFCLLVDNGLIVYDNESPERRVSYAGLIASLKDREAHCSIDADNLEFWDTLKNEKNYQVHIDNVARAHYLKGDKTFDWYNWFSDNVIQLTIPDEIKADIEQSIVVNIQDNIKANNEQVLTPSSKYEARDIDFQAWIAETNPDLNSISKDLATLNNTAHKFWANADKDDKDTHPKQQDVISWLKSQGFSDISAKQGATIIRPKWAADGRRPKE
jgi:hypothetical protein